MQIIALIVLIIMVFGMLWFICEVNKAESEDEDGYAKPPKEDLK